MEVGSLVVRSRVLGEDVEVLVGTSAPSAGAVPVWLLHGRGASRHDVASVLTAVTAPSCTLLAPVGPWLDGAHWWVDSTWRDGRAVERAVAGEVLPAAERVVAVGGALPGARGQRVVAGWSMGGAGALRWLLGRPGWFAGAVLVSPAAYPADPPLASSARTSGAFGSGHLVYDAARHRELMGWARRAPGVGGGEGAARARVSVLVGSDEEPQRFEDGWRSLRDDAATLVSALSATARFAASLSVLPGGHDDALWPLALSRGLAAVAG